MGAPGAWWGFALDIDGIALRRYRNGGVLESRRVSPDEASGGVIRAELDGRLTFHNHDLGVGRKRDSRPGWEFAGPGFDAEGDGRRIADAPALRVDHGDDQLAIVGSIGAVDGGLIGRQLELRRCSRLRPWRRRNMEIRVSVPIPASFGQAEIVDDSFESLLARD